MTRVNVGVCPTTLSRLHLMAEHREIKRIPNRIKKGNFSLVGQPQNFKLGTGHEKFFYTRLGYIKRRYEAIYAECIKRKYNIQYYGSAFEGIDPKYFGDYTPTESDRQLILKRMADNAAKAAAKRAKKNENL